MKEKKYELTDEKMEIGKLTLYRIRALRDFGITKAGDIGGWVESEGNLCQFDDSWIGIECKVYDNSYIAGNSSIIGSVAVINSCITRSIVSGEDLSIHNADIDNSIIEDRYASLTSYIGCCTIRNNSRIILPITASGCIFNNAQIMYTGPFLVNCNFGAGACIKSEKDYIANKIGGYSYTFYKKENGKIKYTAGTSATSHKFKDFHKENINKKSIKLIKKKVKKALK